MSLDKLYREQYGAMKYYAQLFVGDEHGEDVVQNVFLKLHQKGIMYKDAARMWRTMIKNESINFLIAAKNKVTNNETYCRENANEFDRMDVEFDFIANIRSMVNRLPMKCRRCVELYYYEEMTVREIGLLLGLSKSSVHTYLNTARTTLAPYFKQ